MSVQSFLVFSQHSIIPHPKARVVFLKCNSGPVTLDFLPKILQWLPVARKIKSGLLQMTHAALDELAPAYLSSVITIPASDFIYTPPT